MKLSKDELINKINSSVEDTDLAISLIEDVADSFESEPVDTTIIESLKAENENLKYELAGLKERYKARFLTNNESESESESESDEDESAELVEETVIDVKEI